MRALLGLAAVSLAALAGPARAELRVGAAVGAGGQRDATYSGLEARLEGAWSWLAIALGARVVWLDGELRDDWQRPADAIRVLRLLEAKGQVGETGLALAAGALAPAQLGHVADGYRAGLDDRARTGVRASLTAPGLTLGAELDDVLDPGLAGGHGELVRGRLVLATAIAVDPALREAALEASAARRWSRDRAALDAGGGLVVEPGLGGAAVAFAKGAIERRGARWLAAAELRAGTGSVGAAFGPLHELERAVIYASSRGGVGGALQAGVVARGGWLVAGVRARPELGGLATLAAGAPMGRHVQAAGWVALTRDHAAGAAELRIAWARRLASSFELARMYPDPAASTGEAATAMLPAWSATAWFAITHD